MMFYSKKSHNKTVHNCHCSYYKRMDHKQIGSFDTLEDAKRAGYHICKHCAPMWSYYSKEYNKIKEYVSQNGLAYEYMDGEIIVQTPYSNWKIIVNGQKNNIFLYHKNTYNRCNDKTSLVPGYHSQSFRRDTLIEYFRYIAEHDIYRLNHPEQPKKKYGHKKGTKRNKHEVKKQKKRERYQGMMRVLALIENETNYKQMQAAR